jgi:predicted nucleic acid-binding protein
MAGNEPELLYWDADVFLAFVNGEDGRVNDIRGLLAEADEKRVRIVTSVLTVTEVAFATSEKLAGSLDDDIAGRIRGLWLPPSPISLVELHFGVATRSRDLIRIAVEREWSLKPADSIHLATAESLNVTKLHTYNLADFQRWAEVLGFTVEHPVSANPGML